jgi:hypothetical protein
LFTCMIASRMFIGFTGFFLANQALRSAQFVYTSMRVLCRQETLCKFRPEPAKRESETRSNSTEMSTYELQI